MHIITIYEDEERGMLVHMTYGLQRHQIIFVDFPFKSLISNTTSSTVDSRPAAAVSIADARHCIASVLSPPEESIH